MKNKRHRKKTRKLFNRELTGDFEKRIAAYGLTAALLLAGPQLAKAEEVVHTSDLTLGGGDSLAFNLISGVASLGGASTTDGSFAITLTSSGSFANIFAPIGDSDAGFVGTGGFTNGQWAYRNASALNPSSSVSSGRNFAAYTYWASNSAKLDYFGTPDKFVGLRFDIGANTHYGWAQVEMGTGDLTLTMFGYNDTADTASHIPEPSSLGLLAIGAAGLARRRRKKTQV